MIEITSFTEIQTILSKALKVKSSLSLWNRSHKEIIELPCELKRIDLSQGQLELSYEQAEASKLTKLQKLGQTVQFAFHSEAIFSAVVLLKENTSSVIVSFPQVLIREERRKEIRTELIATLKFQDLPTVQCHDLSLSGGSFFLPTSSGLRFRPGMKLEVSILTVNTKLQLPIEVLDVLKVNPEENGHFLYKTYRISFSFLQKSARLAELLK